MLVSLRECHALLTFFLLGSEHSSTCSDDSSGAALLGAGSLEGTGLGGILAVILRGVWRGVFGTIFFFVAGLSTVSFGSGKIGAAIQ